MADKLPSIIVTGASGIVGSSFIEAAKDEFLIYAIARRSQKQAGVAEHPNIKWIQVDIANWISLRWVMHNIKRSGGADYILHLAAYYDFEYTDNPEYERTNVNGTRYMLEQAKILRPKRFIFASSTAACNFPAPGTTINEQTPVDADYEYATTKKKGEEMLETFSKWFPCTVVRFAAVFTDWCEYSVLYVFLSTWFSKSWNSRMLGGKGESAVSYIHAKDLCKLILTVIEKTGQLPQFDTYIASPDGSTSHRQLFEAATRFYFGVKRKPICMPKFMALPGMYVRDFIGRLIGKRPFERPWMLKYVDLKLDTDASYTRKTLSWEPAPRYHILRRLLFLIEKMKSDPLGWYGKNTAALKRVSSRPNLLIYEIMVKLKSEMIETFEDALLDPANKSEFPNFQVIDKASLNWNAGIIYQLLTSSVRNSDRMVLLECVRDLAFMRFNDGFSDKEVRGCLLKMEEVVTTRLHAEPELKGLKQEIQDYITMSIQLTVDEVEDAYEEFEKQKRISTAGEEEMKGIEAVISEMETFYRARDESER